MFFRSCLPFTLLATLAVAEPPTPEAATRLALQNHPELAAARALVAEAEAGASGLGRLPNPEFETEFALGDEERGRFEIGLNQRFPRSSRLRLERVVAAESVALARLEIAVREAEVAARVREALIDHAAARAAVALAEKQAALAREFAESQAAQAGAGQLSALDAAQARFAAREIELSLLDLRAEADAAAAQLAAALGREVGAEARAMDDANANSNTTDPETPLVDLSLPAAPAEARSPAARADLQLAERALAAGEAEVSLARFSGQDDFSAGLFVEGEQDTDAFGSNERELKVGLRFSFPLPVRDVAAPAVASKQAARRRLALERDALAAAARREAAVTAAALRSRHAAALALAGELLPAAREHLAATDAAYRRGEIEIAQVFRARERLAEIERSDLAARQAYHLAVVRHLAATGNLVASAQ